MAKTDVVSDAKDVAKDVQELVVDTADLVEATAEDAVDYVEEKAAWLKTTNAKMILVGVAGIVLGATVAYLVTAKRVAAKEHARADAEIEDVRNTYAFQNKPDLATLAEAIPDEELPEPFSEQEHATAERITKDEGYVRYATPDQVEQYENEHAEEIAEQANEVASAAADLAANVNMNVFESDHPDTYFDASEERQRRIDFPDLPYVITKDEFDENEPEYEQQSLTYYEGDDVLCDAGDKAIDISDKVVGDSNLLRFGHGSGDPEIVYVRNNRLEVDFEVVHHEGTYAKEVLDYDSGESLTHSARNMNRRRQRLSD